MRKAVLISIRPKWCEKIACDDKTIEVRKSRPKMDTPFKCYIYQTGKGGVIGEFVCDNILERIVQVGTNCKAPKYCLCDWNLNFTPIDWLLSDACLTKDELEQYLDGSDGYGWHITDLRIYDAPRELSEFKPPFEKCADKVCDEFLCASCEYGSIKRPPQSWCYVEEVAE